MVGVAEVGVGVALEAGALVGDLGQVAGYVPDGIRVVPGPKSRKRTSWSVKSPNIRIVYN